MHLWDIETGESELVTNLSSYFDPNTAQSEATKWCSSQSSLTQK